MMTSREFKQKQWIILNKYVFVLMIKYPKVYSLINVEDIINHYLGVSGSFEDLNNEVQDDYLKTIPLLTIN
jgi:hypothetical protein